MNRQLFNAMVAQYGIENISGSDIVAWSSGVPCNVQSMKFYGKCEQSTTPTPESPVEIKCNGGSYRYTSTSDSFDITVPKLRGVGKYKDEWDYCTGKSKRYIQEIVFDGTGERGEKITNPVVKENDGLRYVTYTLQHSLAKAGIDALISTHFKSQWAPSDGNIYSNNRTILLLFNKNLNTTDEWNAWLQSEYESGHPVTIWYATAEPIEEFEVGGNLSNLSGRIEPKDVPVTGVDLKAKCVNHSIFSGDKKIVTVSGTDYVEWSGGEMHRNLPSVKLYGAIKQIGTPSPDNPATYYVNDGKYEAETKGVIQTLDTPELKAVGLSYRDYIRDEFDYITGKGLRRVHKVVLDGESEYGKVQRGGSENNVYYARYTPQYTQVINGAYYINCTHFNSQWQVSHGMIYAPNVNTIYMVHDSLTTGDEWNAWLKAQYEAGTPVTIYYALAEPIPFEAQGGTLSNESGRIQFVSSNITTPPPFEVSYITHS